MDYGRLCENSDLWGYDEGCPATSSFSVRGFLEAIASPRLKDLPDFAGGRGVPAGWVQQAAAQYNINPRILLAIAQKEQSFLTRAGSGEGWQRALEWTMGYGATDSGDIAHYKGTHNQVFSCAAGLRRYWDSGLVQRMVGRSLREVLAYVTDPETRAIVPENEATAALYLYTPHASGARGFAQVWAWLLAHDPHREEGDTVRLPDVDYSAFIYGPSDSRHGLPRPTRRYAASGDPAHARTEYWFGGLQGWQTGNCTLTTRSPSIWTASAPKRKWVEFPILGRLTVHELAVEALQRALQDIQDAGLAGQIDVSNTRTVGGTYVCRGVRGGSTASPHSWGIAIDINPNHHLRNGRDVLDTSDTNYEEAVPPSLAAIAPYFTRLGFTWGGHWVSPRDPMHFEVTPLTLLILAGETSKLPGAFVKRCGGDLPTPEPHYPPAGTAIKIVIQYGDDSELLGEGVFDGETTNMPVRLVEKATAWAAARTAVSCAATPGEATSGSYRLEVADHLRDQRKVYLTVQVVERRDQDNAEVGEQREVAEQPLEG